jgi:hypothetical protein
MSLDEDARRALNVALAHDENNLLTGLRAENELLKTVMKNRYLRAALNLIDKERVERVERVAAPPASPRSIAYARIKDGTLGPYYSGNSDPSFHIPISEKRAMIMGLCALGYHIIDYSKLELNHGRVSLHVFWSPLSAADMQILFEAVCSKPGGGGFVLHLASPNPV